MTTVSTYSTAEMDFNVAIDEALKNVNQLERLGKRLTDEQPFIEAFPASVTYTVNLDTNFEDREAFVTGFSKYLEEATVQSDLVSPSGRKLRI